MSKEGNIKIDRHDNVLIAQMLYNDSKNDVLEEIEKTENPEALYIFSYNYNWDDGFDIPKKILNNGFCELSTALVIFYFFDGIRYLENKKYNCDNSKEWFDFVENLYNDIISEKFEKGSIKFIPPLNKVQLYKLRKKLNENEFIFTEAFGSIDLNDIKL